MSTLPKPTVTQSNIFAGGRAPACWQRDFSRSVQKQDNLERACNWVFEAVKPSPLLLQRQPLWGNCLAELVNAPPQEAVEAKKDKPARRKTRVQTAYLDKKPVVAPAAKHRQKQAKQVTAVLTNPPEVKRGFLQQLTKTTVQPKPTHSQTAENSPAAKRFIETTTSPDSKTAVTKHKPADKNSTQAWRKAVANKASKRLKQTDKFNKPDRASALNPTEAGFGSSKAAKSTFDDEQMSAQTERESDSVVEHRKRPLTGKSEKLGKSQSLFEAAWQQQLAGQSVSANHLKTLTTNSQQSSANHAQATRAVENEARLEGVNGTEQKTVPANRLFKEKRPLPKTKQAAPPKPKGMPQIENQQTPTSAQTPLFAAWDALKNRDTAHRSKEPYVAPPQMAATLPALKAQQSPATPEIPLATAVVHQSVHQSTRAEADATPENLDLLASKIKQILDEESRRFGIDV